MDRIFAMLGIFLCLLAGCLAAEYVTVSNDVKVKPSDASHTVDVTLNCTGSRSDLSFYIKNRIQWDFIRKTDGKKFVLTQSFYQAPNSEYAAQHFSSGHLVFKYELDPTGLYVFRLSIHGVTHADNGIYRCSLLNEANNVTDAKDVKLTVVNPVESLSFELHDSNHHILAQSSSPITEGQNPLELTPGQYMVKCDAGGSNPEPLMHFYHDEEMPYVSVTTAEAPEGGRMHYTGTYSVHNLELKAMTTSQQLICTGGITGDFFEVKNAGILVLVQVDKPTVHCENATAVLGDRHAKITCHLTAEGSSDALYCDKVLWYLGNIQQRITERWSDPTKAYDILEPMCEKDTTGLTATLELYTVKPELFKETFFIVYGVGDNAHRHAVELHDVTPVGSAVISTPLSFLGLLVMAVVSKHLANL